jgi:hypothetical protein
MYHYFLPSSLGHIFYLRIDKAGLVGFCKNLTRLFEEDNLVGNFYILNNEAACIRVSLWSSPTL